MNSTNQGSLYIYIYPPYYFGVIGPGFPNQVPTLPGPDWGVIAPPEGFVVACLEGSLKALQETYYYICIYEGPSKKGWMQHWHSHSPPCGRHIYRTTSQAAGRRCGVACEPGFGACFETAQDYKSRQQAHNGGAGALKSEM